MSMPRITLATMTPEAALATIVGSIALQEAAVSHVLNAEGEKIQAVVGMTGTTLQDLQDINASVGTTVDNVSLLQAEMFRKLQSALRFLHEDELPVIPGSLTVALYANSGFTVPISPADMTPARMTLISLASAALTQEVPPVAETNTFVISPIPPGLYTLHQNVTSANHSLDPIQRVIEVLTDGSVTVNGVPQFGPLNLVNPPS